MNNYYCASKLIFLNVILFIIINKIGAIRSPLSIRINKCCEEREILVDGICTNVNKTNSGPWSPIFTDYHGNQNVQVKDFWFAIGIPQCGNRQMFTIHHDPSVSSKFFIFFFCSFNKFDNKQSRDRLALLPDGKLRHYIQDSDAGDAFDLDESEGMNNLWDYAQGKYCMDKVNKKKIQLLFAIELNF